jgi:hypothetical protein
VIIKIIFGSIILFNSLCEMPNFKEIITLVPWMSKISKFECCSQCVPIKFLTGSRVPKVFLKLFPIGLGFIPYGLPRVQSHVYKLKMFNKLFQKINKISRI